MNEQISEKSIEGTNLTDKIKSLQNELGHYTANSSKPKSVNEFLDDYGNETWFIKNLTNSNVIVEFERTQTSELCVTIEANSYQDLLGGEISIPIEKVRTSSSLKKCLNDSIFQRITPTEYYDFMIKRKENIKRANYINKTDSSQKKEGIRLIVTAKVKQFKNFLKDGSGISQEDFINWVVSEPMSEEEIEYCMSSTLDKDIRTLLIHKKQEIIGR